MGKQDKGHYLVKVYLTTCKEGEWWEYAKTDGTTDYWVPGKAVEKTDKRFATLEKAKEYATEKGYERFKIQYLQRPIPPSSTWRQEVVYDSGLDKVDA